MDFIKHQYVGTVDLGYILRCHTLVTHIHRSVDFFNKLSNKVCTKLKKYIELTVIDSSTYSTLLEDIKLNGPLHQLFRLLGHRLTSVNGEKEYEYLMVKLEPQLKKLKKKYETKQPIDSEEENGYIYMIRTRASANVQENVYKIGKTRQKFAVRMNGYDKGYETIVVVPVDVARLDTLESELLNHIGNSFKPRNDYGNEYFEGNRMALSATIISFIQAHVQVHAHTTPDTPLAATES